VIYLDNAATSWPKPPGVATAMVDYLQNVGGNPGRSGHRLAVKAGERVAATRSLVARLLGVVDPSRVTFTLNATHALNLALHGLLAPGDRVVTTSVEHNAVNRPLHALEREGIAVTRVHCGRDGALNLGNLAAALRETTRLVVVGHASNVVGTIQPLGEIADLANRAGALLLVDAAQSAGVLPIDVEGTGVDLLAFAGHKGLLGPQGIGGLVLGERVEPSDIRPLVQGGTGSRSLSFDQPIHLPDRFESGTPNGVGIAGLGAGVGFLLERGVATIRAREETLTAALLDGLLATPGVTVHGPRDPARMTAVVSFTIDRLTPFESARLLDDEFEVQCRAGLHCAPAAHQTIGTLPEGTVRFAPGVFTTGDEIDAAVAAVRRLSMGGARNSG
jgi:cysteine desulfurase / selenocysteine lyase